MPLFTNDKQNKQTDLHISTGLSIEVWWNLKIAWMGKVSVDGKNVCMIAREVKNISLFTS